MASVYCVGCVGCGKKFDNVCVNVFVMEVEAEAEPLI